MELILLPRQDPVLEPNRALPPGMTHPVGTPCPLAEDGVPAAPGSACCSIVATVAARAFKAFGDPLIARLMRDCIDPGHVGSLVPSMRVTIYEAAASYRARRAAPAAPPSRRGARDGEGYLDWPPERFEAAFTSARKVADWYDKVGRLGFGVHARY